VVKRLTKEVAVPLGPFFTPPSGWVGDVIPYEQDGQLWLFYLHEQRQTPKPGTPWSLVTTRDLVHYTDTGVALPNGTGDDADFNAYTGSIVRSDDGVHHLFYTGQNPARVGTDGQALQVVMHASSTDAMRTWHKHPDESFGATEGFDGADWRDPFVFWDERDHLWRMLIAARHNTGASRRRGVIAQCVSTELSTWAPVEPFWDPRQYVAHECPEVFRMGDWWYLVYSEFSDAFVTRYRMSKSLDGPWLAPDRDTVDGRAFYAAKSASLGPRRLFFGWIATREREQDDGAWQWAGTMSTLEATQNDDGTLAFGIPQEIVATYDEHVTVGLEPTALDAPDGYTNVVGTALLPDRCYVRVELDIGASTAECGLLLRTDADGERGYIVRLEPRRNRIVLDRWPRPRTGPAQWQISGDVPFVVELERPADIGEGPHVLEVLMERNLAVIALDRQVCLSTRVYDHAQGHLGLFVSHGSAKVTDLQVRVRSTTN